MKIVNKLIDREFALALKIFMATRSEENGRHKAQTPLTTRDMFTDRTWKEPGGKLNSPLVKELNHRTGFYNRLKFIDETSECIGRWHASQRFAACAVC